MKTGIFSFKGNDGTDIFYYRWLPDKENDIKAMVQIIHGMGEHSARYKEFAQALTGAGFAVYSNDHRGHGKTGGAPQTFGHFADEGGWDLVVSEIFKLTQIIKKENPLKDIFIYGHSLGAFLASDYSIIHGKEIRGMIISGTKTSPGFIENIGTFIARMQIRKNGPKVKSPLLLSLTFGKYNRCFKPNRTRSDWISRDTKKVDEYVADPYCNGQFSAAFFLDLANGLKKINRMENMKKTPRHLPIYLLAGTKDPVSNFTKDMLKVYGDYKKAGIKDISLKFYEGARHEILNELNRQEVYKDIIDWIKDRI